MKTQLMYITPKMAREMLEHNTENRPLRPGGVDNLRLLWQRGEWKVTHQGVAFSKDGILRDGQHRLTFISQLPEGTEVPLNVTTDMDNDTFGAIDQNIRRTPSDILGVSAPLAATAKLLQRIHNHNQANGLTVASLLPFVGWAINPFEELITYCPTAVKIWSSAPVRAAAIVQMKSGSDPDFVKFQYDALIHRKLELMTPTTMALVKQHLSGKIISARTLDLFCRCLRVFDSRKSTASRIQISNQTEVLAQIREFLDEEIFPEKKALAEAKAKVAKPVLNFTRNVRG
jgi:hypothetical protein